MFLMRVPCEIFMTRIIPDLPYQGQCGNIIKVDPRATLGLIHSFCFALPVKRSKHTFEEPLSESLPVGVFPIPDRADRAVYLGVVDNRGAVAISPKHENVSDH